jgi:hypothetical protein
VLLDLVVYTFVGIECSQALPMGLRKVKDCEAFWQVLLGSGGELGLGFGVEFDELLEAFSGVGTVVGVENDPDVSGDFALGILFCNIFWGVLLEMELATLPWSAV